MATIPSIAMIPSGVKASKLYSVLPTDGTGDFTTTRASVATRVNENGLIEEVASNVPRLDYSDGTCPSFLLEPSATNILTYSEGFVTDWNNTNITVNQNSTISPDGALNGTKFIPTITSGGHYLDRNGVTVNSNASASIFAKKGEYKRLAIRSYVTGAYAIFDVNLGTIIAEVNVTAKIEQLQNGWYKCSLNETLNASYGYSVFVLEDASTNPLDTYVGNGADGMYFYGAQLETNSYATSYIKTVATTQTRVADTASKTSVTNLIGQSEGVLFVDFIPKDTATQIIHQVRTSGATNVGQIDIRLTGGTINTLGNDGGSAQFDITGTSFNLGQRYKCAIRYKENDVAFYINGVLIGTDVVASFNSSSKDQVSFGDNITSLVARAGIKDARVYTTALSDAELTSLTTI